MEKSYLRTDQEIQAYYMISLDLDGNRQDSVMEKETPFIFLCFHLDLCEVVFNKRFRGFVFYLHIFI